MAIRRIKNHRKWVWQARVAYRGLRRAAFRASKDDARQAESDLLAALRAEAAPGRATGRAAGDAAPASRVLRARYAGAREGRGERRARRLHAAVN